VGPLLVVGAAPSFDFLFSILQAQKPVLVQAFLPKPAVERFDAGIVRGFPRPGKIQDHAMGREAKRNYPKKKRYCGAVLSQIMRSLSPKIPLFSWL
jgi:hypothetical protein